VFASISTLRMKLVGATGILPSKEADAGALADALETFLLASFLTYGSVDVGVGGPGLSERLSAQRKRMGVLGVGEIEDDRADTTKRTEEPK
jgi:hypothetical protein